MSSAQSSSRGPQGAWPFSSSSETTLLAVAALFVIFAAAARMLRPHLTPHKSRLVYGMEHLPAALCWSALLCIAGALYLAWLRRRSERITTRFSLISVLAVSALLWLPVVCASGFSADDWFLAAAARVRTSLALQPWLAWNALDTVDGNFRPVGTVLYLNHGFSIFGFDAGFLVCTAAAVLLYFIALDLRVRPRLALYAALLFVSRDLLYGPVVWLCSLGDDLVIALGAGCVLLLLRSLRSSPLRSALCHLGAFACLSVALLCKQSAYCIPLLAFLVLVLRPGEKKPAVTLWQWALASLTTATYLVATCVVYRHAARLASGTPYPVAFSPEGIGYLLRALVWFFVPLDMQIIRGFLTIETVLGAAILGLLFWLGWKHRDRLGLDRRAWAFCLLAAFASIALFLFLPSRRVPYYADFEALWLSLPVAVLLSGDAGEGRKLRGPALLVGLVVLGGIAIQLKRTALIPSGTYLGGTYGMDTEAAEFAALRKQLSEHPGVTTVVVRDNSPDSVYPAMVSMLSSQVHTVYVYRANAGQWMANSLNGSLPRDTRDSWTDVSAFHWKRPTPSPPVLPMPDRVLTVPGP